MVLVLLCALAGCSASGGASAPVAALPQTMSVQAPAPQSVASAASSPLVGSLIIQITSKQLADGAILNSSSSINPYFANYAAIGLVVGGKYSQALAWAKWYVAHTNAPNAWGAGCSIYDYSYASNVEASTGTASAVDAHSGSFLTLLKKMYRTGDPTLMGYVKSIRPQTECIALSMTALIASNGLAQVKPGNNLQYLIDNAQVYRGLGDVAWLETNVWGDTKKAAGYTTYQNGVAKGIAALWNPTHNMYASYTTPLGHIETPTWSTWYADSTAQLFPVINGVISPSSPRAIALYRAFNAAWPNWTKGAAGNPSGFPWADVAHAAALMGDTTRVNVFASNVQATYGGAWGWPWYDYESAGLIHAVAAPGL